MNGAGVLAIGPGWATYESASMFYYFLMGPHSVMLRATLALCYIL